MPRCNFSDKYRRGEFGSHFLYPQSDGYCLSAKRMSPTMCWPNRSHQCWALFYADANCQWFQSINSSFRKQSSINISFYFSSSRQSLCGGRYSLAIPQGKYAVTLLFVNLAAVLFYNGGYLGKKVVQH